MVLMESVVSGHQFNTFRDRLAEKIEIVRFDPYSKCIHIVCSMCFWLIFIFYSSNGQLVSRAQENSQRLSRNVFELVFFCNLSNECSI